MKFRKRISAWATGASANVFTTALFLKAANTTGHRARLLALSVAPAGEIPQDVNCSVRVALSDNSTDGTGTSFTPDKLDSAQLASVMTCKSTMTVESTTLLTSNPPFEHACNGRGGFARDWRGDLDFAPKWGPNQALLIQAAPGSAAAVMLTIEIEWEELY